MEKIEYTQKMRITSIDALRAFALFGIIMVHAAGGFCIDITDAVKTPLDSFFAGFISLFFRGKCASIFSILFGISFYIILRKPNYPTSKFVWRCFLLFLIGLLNKFFFKPDALMIYGLMGMILAGIRNLKTKYIFYVSILCFVLSFFMRVLSHYLQIVPPGMFADNFRYEQGHTLFDIIRFWPISVMWYIEHSIHGNFLIVLGKFVLGYWIGKMGYVEIMDKRINKISIVLFGFPFLILLFTHQFLRDSSNMLFLSIDHFVKIATGITGALFYSTLFIWVYNHVTSLKPLFKYMESYGKLGLSNYTFQGIILVILLSDIGLGFKYQSITFYLCTALAFYVFQLFFSFLWLKKYKNGPLEYLWRCATERKWLPLLVK